MGLHEFLDAVLPENPGVHPMWRGRGADCEVPELSTALQVWSFSALEL
jgi:hypothetical protein